MVISNLYTLICGLAKTNSSITDCQLTLILTIHCPIELIYYIIRCNNTILIYFNYTIFIKTIAQLSAFTSHTSGIGYVCMA